MKSYKNIHEAIRDSKPGQVIIYDEAMRDITGEYDSKLQAMMVAFRKKMQRMGRSIPEHWRVTDEAD